MPRSFYEDEPVVEKGACAGLRADLKHCLQNTDCVKKVVIKLAIFFF